MADIMRFISEATMNPMKPPNNIVRIKILLSKSIEFLSIMTFPIPIDKNTGTELINEGISLCLKKLIQEKIPQINPMQIDFE